MAEGIPVTRMDVAASRIAAIREAVRATTHLGGGPEASRLAQAADPAVHAPIYSLPRPLTEANVLAFIEDHLAQREAGEGLLFVRDDGEGTILGYSDIQVWPEWAAGELGGALHPDGTTRASLVWEITRDDWFRLHPA